MLQWRESWATMSNSYLEAAGCERTVSITVLSGRNVLMPLLRQKKHSALKRKHSGLPKQRKQTARQCSVFIVLNGITPSLRNSELLEQAQRDHQIEEAKKVYTTFSELPLEIVVDVRSYSVYQLPEPEEIVLPDFPATTKQQPVSATPAISRRPAAKSYRDPSKGQ